MITLNCKRGLLSIIEKNEERIIVCYEGSHRCSKPENQGIFEYNCMIEVEIIKDKVKT